MSHVQSAAIELASLFDDSLAPVYVLDEDRRIVYCNPALARWTGLAAGQLLGQRCVYQTEETAGTASATAAGLCPPPKVFSGQARVAIVSRASADRRAVYRRGHFLPLSDGGDESAAVVAVLDTCDCSPDAPIALVEADAQLHEQVSRFRRRMAGQYRLDGLLGDSPAMARARTQIELAAETTASVLILGPAGSGKDHAAKAIHYRPREPGALVPLDCAVLDANLLRSTLRAAWSRSSLTNIGLPTLLLNDVDGMPAEAQTELADLMRAEPGRVRLIATATLGLCELVAADEFSPRLAHALSTVTIDLPPLSKRLEDIPLLAQALLEEANANSAKQLGGFSHDALDHLAAYPWPGNVDELAAVVRQAHERASGGEVTARDLPKQVQWAANSAAHPRRADEPIVLADFLQRVERELITRAMRRAKNNKSKAAKLLGLTRPRLYRRLIQLGLEQPGSLDL